MQNLNKRHFVILVAINCLLDAAGDKDEVVRENVSSSLRRIAKKYAVHVLQNAVVYRQKNAKVRKFVLSPLLKYIIMEILHSTEYYFKITIK